MSLIHITNLTFGYDGSYDNIFEDVSFQIDSDWKLGFTGRNGRGKTTFLNLLMGKYEYCGNISASVEFDYFPFEIFDKSQQTIDMIDKVCGHYALWALNKELAQLDVSQDVLYRPFDTLSNGEQTKVMLAALFLKENNFLLIDEPTNHLDSEARSMVGNYLKGKKGFVLVSHDRAFLDSCIDHVLVINKTNIEVQKGSFSSWWDNKTMQDNYELAQNQKLQTQINQLTAASKQTKKWSDKVEKSKFGSGDVDRGFVGHKAAKMMKRSKTLEARQQKVLQDKTGLLKDIETFEELSLNPLKYSKNNLILAEDLAIRYGEKQVFDHLNFSINHGDRVSLNGKNGCGKSSILKLINQDPIAYNGVLQVGSNLIISYVPQDTSFLKGNVKDYAKQCHIGESLFKAILRKLDFSRVQFEKDMSHFSGGQKKKVLLAKSLCQQAHLYIWDEPLNFIDIYSRMQIEELILKYQPTMLFVEHDHAFVETVATKCINL